MTALTCHQRDTIEADREAEWARICARRPDVHAKYLIRLALAPDKPFQCLQAVYQAQALLQVTGNPEADAQRAIDDYFAN